MPETWSRRRPTIPGWYWYYGDAFAGDANFPLEPELCIAQVSKMTNGFMYVVNGNFISERKEHPGWWLPISTPELPEEVTHA